MVLQAQIHSPAATILAEAASDLRLTDGWQDHVRLQGTEDWPSRFL
jgi:hypothetical protein